MKPIKILVLLLIITITPFTKGISQVQRMGVPQGTYKIPANSSIRVDSYCLDYTRTQPSSRNIFKHVLDAGIDALVDNLDKNLNLQDAIDKGIIEITGKKFVPEEYINLVRGSMNKSAISSESYLQNYKLIKLWEATPVEDRNEFKTIMTLTNCINSGFFEIPEMTDNILFPIMKSWAFLPDSVKSLFNEKYNYLLEPMKVQIQEQMDNIRDHTFLQLVNKTNSDIVLTLKNDIILGETKENCELLIELLGGMKFENQNDIWNNQIRAILTILEKSKCVDKSNENSTLKFLEGVKCFQKKNKLKPSGIIDEQTEKLLYAEYKKVK